MKIQTSINENNSSKLTNASLSSVGSARTSLASPFELPVIQVDKSTIDFGVVAEGCSDSARVVFKISNNTSKSIIEQQKQLEACLRIEFNCASDW